MTHDTSNNIFPDNMSGAAVLRMLWVNWGISFGSVSLMLLLSLVLPPLALPFVACVIAAWLRFGRRAYCDRTIEGRLTVGALRVATHTFVASAFVMMAILILCTPLLVGRVIVIPMYNDELPFVTCLVMFPLMALFSGWWLLFGRRRIVPEVGVSQIRQMLPREEAYQVRILMVLSLVLGAVEYWYYFARYINSNLNSPDRFFFVFMPIGIFLLSLFFMGGRYTTLGSLVEAVNTLPQPVVSTLVRFLIFSDNQILVRPNHLGLYDTPAEALERKTDFVSPERASEIFERQAETTQFTLRYLYTSEAEGPTAGGLNIKHFAAILDGALPRTEVSSDDLGDLWVGMYDIRRLAAEGKLAPLLARELVRIYAITMAWKTYDRSGRRLYPIRNYKPTFRLRDIAKWDVDYDDLSWLEVARYNEDKLMWRIRNFFSRSKRTAHADE